MRKLFLMIITAAFLLCGCGTKTTDTTEVKPTEIPTAEQSTTTVPEKSEESSQQGAETSEGEMMYSSMVYSTLDTEGKRIWVGDEAGIKEFRVPESFTNARGGIRAYFGFEMQPGTGVTKTDIMYIPSSEEAYDAWIDEISAIISAGLNNEESIKKLDDASVKFQNSLAILFTVIGMPHHGSPDEAKEFMVSEQMNSWLLSEEDARKYVDSFTFLPAGSADDYSFYLAYSPNSIRNAFDGDKASWKEEYDQLWKEIPSYVEAFTFARPEGLHKTTDAGTVLRFQTTNLNGEPVSSEELFGSSKATMVNVWTTTCTGCISEMPELNRMAKEFEEKGGRIIGIVYDAVEPDLVEEAKEIESDLKVSFMNLIPTDEIKNTLSVQSFPTTYFVNEKGELSGAPVVGSQVYAYRTRMTELLGEGQAE